jgi:hypothetical protein
VYERPNLLSWLQKQIKGAIQSTAKKIDRSLAEFRPYGVDKITGDAASMDLSKAKSTFPAVC